MAQPLSPTTTSSQSDTVRGHGETSIAKAARLALVALVLVDIVALTALRIMATSAALEPSWQTTELACQALLVLSFAGLVLTDYRAAIAIVVLELAVAGASGKWTVFPGGVSGRIIVDALVIAGGLLRLGLAAHERRLRLGRYTVHALILSVALPGVWMTIGVLNGNASTDVFGDGNGHFFFAFAVALTAAAQQGDLGWLRRWFLVACAVNALVITFLTLTAVSSLVPANTTLNEILAVQLDMGGAVAFYSHYSLSLSLASAVYLQIGIALVTWELLRKPRRVWPWLVLATFVLDLVATFRRGLWLGGILAVVVVVLVGSAGLRRTAQMLVAGAALAVVVTVAGFVAGSNLPQYVIERAASAFDTGDASNAVKIEQAQVLTRHIAERPVLGWGFGTIAPDYSYGHIYSYEIQYLDLTYKTGVVGLLLFLSFPLRLLLDSVRGRLGRVQMAAGVTRQQAAVPVAIIVSILAVSVTNPYLLAAFGLAPIILCIAWLDPFESKEVTRVP